MRFLWGGGKSDFCAEPERGPRRPYCAYRKPLIYIYTARTTDSFSEGSKNNNNDNPISVRSVFRDKYDILVHGKTLMYGIRVGRHAARFA